MKRFLFLLFFVLLLPYSVFAISININTASLSELDQISGVGPVMAQRIIGARPFSSVDDLNKVKGIGEKTLAKIKSQGFACIDCKTEIIKTENKTEQPGTATGEAQPKTYPAGIFINEILPSPTGADETDEWIEVYNLNDFEVDLSGWKIRDTTGTKTTYEIPSGQKILTKSFLLFKRPDTKIMLNNDGDAVNLLFPDGKIADSTSYANAPSGQSYNKINNSWQWSTSPTPGLTNEIIQPIAQKPLPKAKKSVKNNIVEAGLADVSQSMQNQDPAGATQGVPSQTNPWFLFFTVLAITLILASITLFIKLKFLNNHVRS